MTDRIQGGEGSSIWERLRHRKVVQWGVAYVAGAWGLLQGIGFLADAFHWADSAKQLATLALLIGLPIALVLAWYHGDKGQQRVSGAEFSILVGLFIVGGGIFWWHQRAVEPTTTASTATQPTPTASTVAASDPRPSIAVLPFDNRSRLEDDAYFVDGIHDDILTQLSKISALRVISRTSVEQFRDTKLPVKAIADQLGVTKILEGGVQRAGDRVRINVQLIDASSDAHLWAESFDRELTAASIFAIQSEVAAAIADALKAALTPAERSRVAIAPTQNLEAWEAYQFGRQRMKQRTSSGLAESERSFRQAINLDPRFALAYAGLADALSLQVTYSGRPVTVLLEADKLAAKALELDSTLAEGWASRGSIAHERGEFGAAEELLRRAVALNPNYAQAHHWLSAALASAGRPNEALQPAEIAVRLDPRSPVVHAWFGVVLERVGRFDEAAQSYRRAIEIDPSIATAYANLSSLQAYARNRYGDAVRLVQQAITLDAQSPWYPSSLASLYLDLGDLPEARRLIAEARAHWPDALGVDALFISGSLRDADAAARYARRLLKDNPRDPVALTFVRNADLDRRDYRSARDRYAKVYPELFGSDPSNVNPGNYWVAIDLVPVLQRTGEAELAALLLSGSEQAIRQMPRLGYMGFWLADVQIHALRSDKVKALAALRDAKTAGWRGYWRYYRDVDPNLASIRNEPEFKAAFADIERDMARQRAELAARHKDAPLDLAATGT